MLPILRSRLNELERQRSALLDDLLGLSAEQLSFHPAPGAWSLAQLVQHLVLVEESTLEFLEKKPPRPASSRTIAQRIRWEVFRRLVPLPVRVKAPTAIVIPREEASMDALVARWNAARARWAGYLERVQGDALPLIVFKHPIGGPLTILETLTFIGTHMRHHAHQIHRIRTAPGWPSGAAASPRAPVPA